MGNRSRLFFAAVAAGGVLTAQRVAPRDDRPHPVMVSSRIAVRASVDEPGSFRVGSPVVLHLAVRSVGPKSVHIGYSIAEADYEVAVTDAAGKEPPRTA